jgi:protein ImuA
MMQTVQQDIVRQLQKEVLSLQRHKAQPGHRLHTGLWEVEKAFPEHTIPLGVVHEFVSDTRENAAATNGFIAGLVGGLVGQGNPTIWVSTKRTVFPPALDVFGFSSERVVFIDPSRQKDALWAIEEALKCNAVSAVIGELGELGFTESRRLQLAVEQSRATGFMHVYNPRRENVTACVSRWKIRPLASDTGGMPGLGFPRWHVELAKVRNGRPGAWQVEWSAGRFRHLGRPVFTISELPKRKAG